VDQIVDGQLVEHAFAPQVDMQTGRIMCSTTSFSAYVVAAVPIIVETQTTPAPATTLAVAVPAPTPAPIKVCVKLVSLASMFVGWPCYFMSFLDGPLTCRDNRYPPSQRWRQQLAAST
jgi:hypothetical protein